MKGHLINSVFIIGIVLWTSETYATGQEPDILIFKGKRYSLYTNPLDGYFRKYPDKKPKSDIISTGNWRGYVATFELIDSTLFLRDIVIETNDSKKSVMNEVFPGQSAVAIEWFNGLLTAPYGQLLKYVHMGYGSTFENYLIFEIRLGQLTKVKDFKYEEYVKFKDKQFELFKETEDYKKIVLTLKGKFKSSDEQLESFMKINWTEYMTYIIED
jgi:hypothetical protein